MEVLKDKWVLLFEEKFQAWPGGPVLKSVFDNLNEIYEELDSFFDKIENIENETILQYLERNAKKYFEWKKNKIYEMSLNNIWKNAREKLENENEVGPIEKDNIIPFIQWEKNRKRRAAKI